MSKLETNQVDPSTGTTLTLGTSGDTIAIPSGVTIANSGTATGFGGTNTPAFEATLSANQTVSDSADVKVQFNTETFDTDNCYDNSSNYRFTPTTAGKYYVYARLQCDSNAANNLQQGFAKIYKNGSRAAQTQMNMNGNFPENIMVHVFNIIDMNGSSDYLEIYVNIDDTSGDGAVRGTSSYAWTSFGAYRIIE
jgi:hypothetical protein